MVLLLATAGCGEQAGQDARVEEADRLMEDTLAGNTSTADDAPNRNEMTFILEEWTIRLGQDTTTAGPARFRVRNYGDFGHGFVAERDGQQWTIEEIPPGEWAHLDLELEPGTYRLYCPIEDDEGDHSEQGIEAFLHVQPDQARTEPPDA